MAKLVKFHIFAHRNHRFNFHLINLKKAKKTVTKKDGKARSKVGGKKRLIWKIILYSVLAFFGSSIFFTILYRFVPPPVTYLMIARKYETRTDGKTTGIDKKWVDLDQISPYLVTAVVASEDNNFREHFGFDFDAIKKVSESNKKGKKIKGASTISQQTAKNVFLWPARSWIRKGMEVYFTVLIEVFWGKKRIMEMYLNEIEMGDGIYGAEAASQEYFHKSAKNLTRDEAAAIAAVLPNPRKWHPDKPTAYIQHKTQKIMEAMDRIGPVSFK